MVQLFPRVTYYNEAQMEIDFSPAPLRNGRATGAAAALLSALVGLGITRATGIGTSAYTARQKL